jgi:hypothetical protein
MAKTVSLKLDESTYSKAEKIRKRLKLPRNTYIRKAISHYNSLCARKLLEREYGKASQRWAQLTLSISRRPSFSKTCPRISDNSDSLELHLWSMRLCCAGQIDL